MNKTILLKNNQPIPTIKDIPEFTTNVPVKYINQVETMMHTIIKHPAYGKGYILLFFLIYFLFFE